MKVAVVLAMAVTICLVGLGETGCDCEYQGGAFGSFSGCKITTAAPAGKACRCSYRGAWTCSGYEEACIYDSSPDCVNPSTSFTSCLQGAGDCDGYHKVNRLYRCACSYSWGGCKIYQEAPSFTACRCSYKGAWRCSGSVTRCSNTNAYRCERPDKSHTSCLLGGGDCGAY